VVIIYLLFVSHGLYIVIDIFINYEKEMFDVIKVTVAHVVFLDFKIPSPTFIYLWSLCKSACRTELTEQGPWLQTMGKSYPRDLTQNPLEQV
jgi:hypothetical protein